MNVFGPLLLVALKSLVVLFPLTVGWLAFRRLALSQSSNAWIYAAMCLFAAVTSAGVLPWTLGLTGISWPLLALALICPALWVGVILVCDVSRRPRYAPEPLTDAARLLLRRSRPKLAPLLLTQRAVADEVPKAVFRHRSKSAPSTPKKPARSASTTTLLNLARDIRGNQNSEDRRPRLLPPPDTSELPFLSRSHRA